MFFLRSEWFHIVVFIVYIFLISISFDKTKTKQVFWTDHGIALWVNLPQFEKLL